MILTGAGTFVHPVLPQSLWYLPWTSLPPLLALWAVLRAREKRAAAARSHRPRPHQELDLDEAA
ncbi:hypothetical protein [Streptomyces altiplanensis]